MSGSHRHPAIPPRLTTAIAEAIVMVRSEYDEMPGLMLTASQAQRLWGLDSGTCAVVLATLVDQQFLRQTVAGTYIRRSGS
jgi:hypothetical protein